MVAWGTGAVAQGIPRGFLVWTIPGKRVSLRMSKTSMDGEEGMAMVVRA